MERDREPVITKRFILEHTEEDEVDLSLCYLSKVPVKELAQVPRGVKLDLSQNKLAQLPENFFTLKHITELDLSKNQLFELPHNFGGLLHLQRLDLYGNKLVTLPLSFSQLKRLKWLDVRNNNFEEELARVAGDCLSDEECKQCAVNVVKFLQEKSANEERRRQKDLERQRELQRRQKEQNEEKLQAARQRKAIEKQRRKEEWERRKAEEVRQNGEQENHVTKVNSSVSKSKKSSQVQRSWIGCFCTFMFTLLVLALVAGVLLTFIDNPWQQEMQSALAHIKQILTPTPS